MVAITEQELSTRIKDQIYWDGRVNAADVGVNVEGGKAVLTGTVPSYRAKMAATEDAWTVAGIETVDNQLRVQYPPTVTVPPDAEITSNVKNSLVWDPDIDSTKIDVTVAEGIATLTGTVDAYWKKFQAENDAYWVTGVIDVVNEIGVVPTDQPIDEAIARDIEAALGRNINVNVEDVTVEVENGVVTLTGTVPTWAAWRAAYNTAIYTSGVVDVVDRLVIRYS
jgi:osmotically-inducible protein OsmY